ncbi:hypothetical protein OCH7691_01223 [Oceanibacterium hippocampi]|uniref:Uncharacterized protein n=1 Tax=Oceanibacterium hippocampi TaxID=745714 RepID=A0A1Y5S4T8_9PROT|nr:hypothetical protein OCH7691_01223 [Oceanibacterium hippocampi]
MSKFSLFLIFLIAAAIAGGGVFLSQWDIPAPTTHVEKVISNDRFKN